MFTYNLKYFTKEEVDNFNSKKKKNQDNYTS